MLLTAFSPSFFFKKKLKISYFYDQNSETKSETIQISEIKLHKADQN